MKVYVYEVRHIEDGNLERYGVTGDYARAVAAIKECGVQQEQVYLAAGSGVKVLVAFGVGETHDAIPVVFKILKMEVQ